MAKTKTQSLVIRDLRGGRNGHDAPQFLPETQVVEALNVEWYGAGLAKKRAGATAYTFNDATVFTDDLHSLAYCSIGDEGSLEGLEVYGLDQDDRFGWWGPVGGWLALTVADAAAYADAASVREMSCAVLNGKVFMAYNSAVNRLHVKPGTGAVTVRRVGLATPAAPTVANSAGGGTYTATIRYYKVAYTVQSSSVTTLRSELSSSVSFTPDGSHTAAVITKPATISENETHWEIYASADNLTFYLLTTVAVGTTTYSDSAAVTSYNSGTPAPVAGINTVPTSARFLTTDDNRLIMAGSWEDGADRRVWFTPVLGTSDIGDDERIPNTTNQKNWVDIEEDITGLSPTLRGSFYVFSYRRIWQMAPTGDAFAPYRRREISKSIGCIRHQTIVMGEDEYGNPAVYFLSHRGPYRITSDGALQYLGYGIRDLWDTVNLKAAAAGDCVGFGLYYTAKQQVWWWVKTAATGFPTVRLVYDVTLKAWAKHTGASCLASCAVEAPNLASVTPRLYPLVSITGTTESLAVCDLGTDDASTTFQAYIKTKAYRPWGAPHTGRIVGAYATGTTQNAVTLTLTLDRNFGLETRTSTIVTTAAGSETRDQRRFEAAAMEDAAWIQAQIGDGAASAATWTLDELTLEYEVNEPL